MLTTSFILQIVVAGYLVSQAMLLNTLSVEAKLIFKVFPIFLAFGVILSAFKII